MTHKNTQDDISKHMAAGFLDSRGVDNIQALMSTGELVVAGCNAMILNSDRADIYAHNVRAFRQLLLKIPRNKTFRLITEPSLDQQSKNDIINEIFEMNDSNQHEYIIIKKGNTFGIKNSSLTVTEKKHPVFHVYREMDTLKARVQSNMLICEGELLTDRAIADGLPVLSVLYSNESANYSDCGVIAYKTTNALMSSITTTRPVPSVMCMVYCENRDVSAISFDGLKLILICDSLSNPDNLGMTLRTADACGADAVVILGEKGAAMHKSCVRSARGAVGRMLILYCNDESAFFSRLKNEGFNIDGTSSKSSGIIESVDLPRACLMGKNAVIVGNENSGIRQSVLQKCTHLVKIPMSPGQSSHNVAVAAGILLYEVGKQYL